MVALPASRACQRQPVRNLIAEYVGGGWGHERRDSEYSEGAWVIRGTDIPSVQIGEVSSCPYRYHKSSNIRSRRLRAGDIVFEVSGGSKDQPVGRTALITPNLLLKFGDDVICASFCKLIRPNAAVTEPVYFYYYLQHIYANREIAQYQVQSTGISNFKFETFLDEQVLELPPLPTQRKIAAILSVYDDLIENNTRRIALLEAMAQALYREWFVNFRFPGHESCHMVDSPLGPVPEGWAVKTLGDIAQEVRQSVDPATLDPDTPYIGLEHMPRRSIALADWGAAKDVQSTKLAFHKGEILFGKIRPYFHKVGVAPIDGVCSTDAIVIVPRTPEYFPLALGCVSSDDFVRHATQTSQGTKMPRANWSILTRYPVALPPTGLLNCFNGLIADIMSEIANLVMRCRALRQARDLLLPKLVSGEVNVEELESSP